MPPPSGQIVHTLQNIFITPDPVVAEFSVVTPTVTITDPKKKAATENGSENSEQLSINKKNES